MNTTVCQRGQCDHLDISHDRGRSGRERHGHCWICDCQGFRGWPTWKRAWREARWQWAKILVRLGVGCGECGFRTAACVCAEEEG